jgi:hypothetical protein
MVKNWVDIESAYRPLNALSKILGLAHFSGYKNSLTGKIKHEENREWGFANVIWCVGVICLIGTGFVGSLISMYLSSRFSIFENVIIIFSIPVGYLGTLLALIGGLTWNRNKFAEFVLKMSVIDQYLFGAKREDIYKKQYKSCIVQLVVLSVLLIPIYLYDVFVYGEDNNYMIGILHVSNIIQGVNIVQFINVVWMITERLEYLNKEVKSCLELGAELNSNLVVNVGATCISTNESRLQLSLLEADNKTTGVLVSDFAVYTRRRPSFCEVERVIRVRKLYNMLFRVSKIINGIYGMNIVLDLIYNFINVVLSVDGVIGLKTGSLKMKPSLSYFQIFVAFICWFVVALVKVIVVCVSCNKASAQVAVCYEEVQQLLIVDALRPDTRRQLKLLLQQVSGTRAVFTACDVVGIDLSVLFTFVSTVATYTVVLVQLK